MLQNYKITQLASSILQQDNLQFAETHLGKQFNLIIASFINHRQIKFRLQRRWRWRHQSFILQVSDTRRIFRRPIKSIKGQRNWLKWSNSVIRDFLESFAQKDFLESFAQKDFLSIRQKLILILKKKLNCRPVQFFLIVAFQKLVFSDEQKKSFRRVSQVKAEADNLLGMLWSPLMMIFTPRD